ncbi:hypothetical protein [Rariglobus hedericola]|uniref:O-antigen polysaccharide polymerase Wzy n=1 Tax=Rariglobus hedericola TaxID=2597822 RepID=A0A556QPW7_9BACT|nr:hypothetical protein [Rariglobus hedericola]TSJ78693.1 hypothetical protein FPL22_05145 [Rariglobus hedericola]
MSNSSYKGPVTLDRYTRISELGDTLHSLLNKGIPIVGIIILLLVLKMFLQDAPGWLGLLWIGAGTCIGLLVWHSAGIGLPLLPLLAIQHFAVYGIPLINRNETLADYSDTLRDRAGMEVLILMVVCSISWRFGMQLFRPSPPVAHTLRIFVTEGNKVLNRLGVALILTSAGYELLNTLHLTSAVLSLFPAGTQSIVVAIIGAAGMSGYFLVSMFIASGEAHRNTRTIFGVVLVSHLILMTASILLSSVINIIGAVTLGLFWGSGRMPKMFLLICAITLSFLNIGKFEMRERYWGASGQVTTNVSIAKFPAYYWEWAGYSTNKIFGQTDDYVGKKNDNRQTMLSRMDNMQNLLYVSNKVTVEKTPVLGGETYSLIPPLLIPRILWPDKPRAHEGQALLNVHYGRQSQADTFTTYVAWGLLPEAYGNFGPIWGAVILGVTLGIIFAWIENATAAKPLLSLEGMVTFSLLIGFAASFEMVSSVLVTSLFQSIVTISMACIPFVQSTSVIRPEESEAESE